jgi:hypothetical protein
VTATVLRDSLYVFGLVSHVPLSLLNAKMTDGGRKLCMSRCADGIATGPNGRYNGSSECHLERMCYLGSGRKVAIVCLVNEESCS